MKKKRLTKKEKIEKNAAWIVSVILISIILVVAVFFIRQKLLGPTFDYKGYKVTEFQIEGINVDFYDLRAPIRIYGGTGMYHIILRNDPRELQDIEVGETTRKVLLDPKPRQVYLTFDPEMPNKGYVAVAIGQIAKIIGTTGVFELPVTGAVTKEIEGLENKTITCDNSGKYDLVINLEYADETRVFVDEHSQRCVKVQGTDEYELIKAADKVVLTLLGI